MRHVCLPVPLPVRLFARMQKLSTHWKIFIKCDIVASVEILSRKFEFHYNLTTITGTLHEHLRKFTVTSSSTLLRMRNVLEKNCRENQNTIFCSTTFSVKTCRLSDNVKKYGTSLASLLLQLRGFESMSLLNGNYMFSNSHSEHSRLSFVSWQSFFLKLSFAGMPRLQIQCVVILLSPESKLSHSFGFHIIFCCV
jgi:hypothetical protein